MAPDTCEYSIHFARFPFLQKTSTREALKERQTPSVSCSNTRFLIRHDRGILSPSFQALGIFLFSFSFVVILFLSY